MWTHLNFSSNKIENCFVEDNYRRKTIPCNEYNSYHSNSLEQYLRVLLRIKNNLEQSGRILIFQVFVSNQLISKSLDKFENVLCLLPYWFSILNDKFVGLVFDA